MQSKAFLVLGVVALAVLAGCSSPPPAGDLATLENPMPFEGTASAEYQTGGSPTGTLPNGQPGPCAPAGVPVDDLHCTESFSHISAHFMTLPEADGEGWGVYAVGTEGERQLQKITPDASGMYELNYVNDDEDISGLYQTLELRMGDFVYAKAPSAAGNQTFTLEPITGVTATGTWKENVLDVTITGLPNATGAKYYGRLYILENGNVTPKIEFPVKEGANHYELEEGNIDDYAEFHIHVGKSKINLYKAAIN